MTVTDFGADRSSGGSTSNAPGKGTGGDLFGSQDEVVATATTDTSNISTTTSNDGHGGQATSTNTLTDHIAASSDGVDSDTGTDSYSNNGTDPGIGTENDLETAGIQVQTMDQEASNGHLNMNWGDAASGLAVTVVANSNFGMTSKDLETDEGTDQHTSNPHFSPPGFSLRQPVRSGGNSFDGDVATLA